MTLTAHLSCDYVVNWGDTGYQVAGSVLHTGPGYGAVGDWQVAASGYGWGPDGALDNQSPFFTYNGAGDDFALSGPYLVIKDGKVVGVGNNADFFPAVGVAPELNLGGGPIHGCVGAAAARILRTGNRHARPSPRQASSADQGLGPPNATSGCGRLSALRGNCGARSPGSPSW